FPCVARKRSRTAPWEAGAGRAPMAHCLHEGQSRDASPRLDPRLVTAGSRRLDRPRPGHPRDTDPGSRARAALAGQPRAREAPATYARPGRSPPRGGRAAAPGRTMGMAIGDQPRPPWRRLSAHERERWPLVAVLAAYVATWFVVPTWTPVPVSDDWV